MHFCQAFSKIRHVRFAMLSPCKRPVCLAARRVFLLCPRCRASHYLPRTPCRGTRSEKSFCKFCRGAAATSAPAPWSARPSGCDKPARPMVGASLGLQQARPPHGRRAPRSAAILSFGIKKEHPVRMLPCYVFPVLPCAASSLIRSEILREIRTNASASSSPMISRRLCASSSERSCTAR